MGSRNFANAYPDYQGESPLIDRGKIASDFTQGVKDNIVKLLAVLDRGLTDLPSYGDYTVYTGFAGQALLFLHLSDILGEHRRAEFLEKALSLLKAPLSGLKKKKFSFLGGDSGVLAVAAVVHDKAGMKDKSKDCVKRLELLHKYVIEKDPSVPDELLFGRVGYLYSLLFTQKYLGEGSINNSIILKVCERVIKSGQQLAAAEKWACPLMFTWHDKHYLGAAHGLSGICFMLMQVDDPRIKAKVNDLVRPTIDFLLTLQFPSGNFPSSIGSTTGDKLVHWCHGAPGWVHLFVQAYRLFGEENYLAAAKSCGEVVWERGLLKKGDSLCHGTAGNGYVFLSLYRLTGEQKYLYRACKFAEWCFDYDNHRTRFADRPLSLFEGVAGTIYFLADMLAPESSRFPAFEL